MKIKIIEINLITHHCKVCNQTFLNLNSNLEICSYAYQAKRIKLYNEKYYASMIDDNHEISKTMHYMRKPTLPLTKIQFTKR